MTFLIIRTIRGAYHLRMISYRATLTNRTGLGPKEGEVSAVHLHRDPFFLTGKFDPILHRTDSLVNDLWVNLPVVNSWTSLPVNYVLSDRADWNSSLWTGLPVHYLPEGTGRDKSHRPNPRNRIGPGVNLQTSPPDTGQLSYLPVKGRKISLPVSSNCLLYNMEEFQWGKGHPQSTTIRYMGNSSVRGPTVTSRNRYSTGPDQTNSSDYRKIGYRTDNVPDRTGHRRSVVSRDRSKSTDCPSRLDGQGFRIPLRNSSPNNRSPSFSSPSREHRSEKKKCIRHSSSSVSSISSSLSSSRSR